MDENHLRTRALMKLLKSLASLKLTLVTLILLGIGVAAAYIYQSMATWVLAGPMLLFALNLSAAVITNPVFHRNRPLLLFHLCLITMVLLVAVGRLTYLNGTLEMTNGIPFNGELTSTDAGPLHYGPLDKVQFVSDSFEIDYDVGLVRGDTRNKVRWVDEKGEERHFVIRDYYPLVTHGYRFYPTPNKGFAPQFVWIPHVGRPQEGVVHLPAYPLHEFRQVREWTPPGTLLKLWTQLQFNELILDPRKPSQFRLPERHKLVVRYGDQRYEMTPGSQIALPGGRLLYQGLTMWMGYTVFYDWTMDWLLWVSLLAVISLAWHFWNKFAARPWSPT